jgi:hypothetical protein
MLLALDVERAKKATLRAACFSLSRSQLLVLFLILPLRARAEKLNYQRSIASALDRDELT